MVNIFTDRNNIDKTFFSPQVIDFIVEREKEIVRSWTAILPSRCLYVVVAFVVEAMLGWQIKEMDDTSENIYVIFLPLLQVTFIFF